MYKSIAIDGPAGSGKSTIAQLLAKNLQFNYINSGMFYRAVGLYFIQHAIDYTKPMIDKSILNAIYIKWDHNKLYLNDKDVTTQIQSSECSSVASQIAVNQDIRNWINHIIRTVAKSHNIIVDGRDIGSAVLVDATLKVFLDASIQVRAARIFKRNQSLKNTDKSLAEIENDIAVRDHRDYTRTVAPLKRTADAIYIDCSNLDVEQTVDLITQYYNRKVSNDN